MNLGAKFKGAVANLKQKASNLNLGDKFRALKEKAKVGLQGAKEKMTQKFQVEF